MSDRCTVHLALHGEIIESNYCRNWSLRGILSLSLYLAATADGSRTIEEVYYRIGCDFPYEKDIVEDCLYCSEFAVVVDLDRRCIYYGISSILPYNPDKYENWPLASNAALMRAMRGSYDEYGYDWALGSECFPRHRVLFKQINLEAVVQYCEEILDWRPECHVIAFHSEESTTRIRKRCSEEIVKYLSSQGFPDDISERVSDWAYTAEIGEHYNLPDVEISIESLRTYTKANGVPA